MFNLRTRSKSLGPRPRLEKLEDRANPGAGALDPTFGGDHKVTTPIGSSDDQANSVAIQADGKIVVAGYSFNGSNNDFALTRYNVDGTLDTTFGGDGKLTTAIGSSQDTATSVAIQLDGKIVAAGFSGSGSNDDFALARYNPDGSLDTSFDGDGKLTTPFGPSFDLAQSVAIQADGKIIAAGYSFDGAQYDFALARYNADGSLDNTFDGDGKLTTAIGSSVDQANSVAIQVDGKIVAAGYSFDGVKYDFALARYNADGSLDTTFDGDGKLTTAISSANDFAKSLLTEADGKIVAAGFSGDGNDDDFALARFNANGSLDTSFDGDGKLTTIFGSSQDRATSVAIQADGKLVAAGFSGNGSNDVFALARYSADGSLDFSFDGDGKLTTAIGPSGDHADSVAIQSDGKIVAAGYSGNGNNNDFALTRYNPDGSLDPLSDGDGKLTTAIGSAQDVATSVAIQADGKIVAAGNSFNGNYDFALARYNADGTLDTSFDGDGKVTTAIGSASDVTSSVAIQADGKIIAAGQSYNGSNNDFALTRYNSDGSLDTTFDGDGKLITAFGPGNDGATSVAIQADGKIVAAGYTVIGSNGYFALARYNADGSLDTTFDGDGKLTTAIGSIADESFGVAIQADGKIVAAGESFNAGKVDFALARYNTDGSLDTSFDGDGKLTTAIGLLSVDQAYSVAIQADGKIVVAGSSLDGGKVDFALTRYNVDGSLDTSFDGDGILTTNNGSSMDQANSVAIQADGKIVAAGQSFNGSNVYFALARYNADGSLDVTFDGDGRLTTAIGSSNNYAYNVAIQADGKIVAAGTSYNGSKFDFAVLRVRGDNHAPITTPGTFQAVEDSVLKVTTPTYISDADGDLVNVTLMSAPTHGTLQLAPYYGTFTYTPDPNYVGPDSFLYKVKDPEGAFDIGAIAINVVNDAADRLEVVPSPGIVTFTESVPPPSTPVVIDAGVRIGTALEDTIISATVKFTSGYVPKKDTLTFATLGVIKGKFNALTGTLTLTGAASPADYQAALRTVKYANYSAQPVDAFRTIAIQLKDSAGSGDPATRLLRVIGVDTKPTVTLTGPVLTYKQRGKALAVASTLKITDVDNTRLMGATISIGAGFAAGQDALSVTTRSGITANYNSATGILTLAGNATLATYQAVLRSLKFTTPVGAPTGLRTLSITVNDGLLDSDPVMRNVTVL